MYEALIADAVAPIDGGFIATAGSIVYRLEASTRDATALEARQAPVMVLVELEVAEETMSLVGFADDERRELYRGLVAVNGIGRRSALAVLDCGEVIDTLRAVAANDSPYFRTVPGLGKQRIAGIMTELGKRYTSGLPTALKVGVQEWVTAREALQQQGSSFDDAERRLRAAQDVDGVRDAEQLLNHA